MITIQVFRSLIDQKVIAKAITENGERVVENGVPMWVAADHLSAIIPGELGRREELRSFSGDIERYAEVSDPEYHGYAVPKGTLLTPGAGAKGVTVTGASAFFSANEKSLVDLGVATADGLTAAFDAWKADQGESAA